MKTTAKHFAIFKAECLKWIEVFGLKDYEIHFSHSDKVCRGNQAHCERNSDSRIARLALCQTWQKRSMVALSNDAVRVAAFEEVCHIFLYRLSSCAFARYIMEHEINEAEHSIIRVLQGILMT